MMQEIFNSAKRPFYASCGSINLQRIEPAIYKKFIKETFEKHRYKILDAEIEDILNYTQVHTYYTQSFCHQLFLQQQKNITAATLQQVKQQIMQEREAVFFQYRNLLTNTQWQLLKAMAKEEKVEQPYNKKFINTYKLGSSAIVKRSLESLLQKEMLYYNSTIANPYYAVYDKFLMHWLQQLTV